MPSHYVTQMVTGHRSFGERLYNLGLVDNPRCICPLGELETPEHILYECTKYNSLRDKLRERALVEDVVWPPPVDFWMRKECHRDFAAYVGRVLRLRADEELRA